MSRSLAEDWRVRIAAICDEVAAAYGAHVDRVDGRAITYHPLNDSYALILVWPDRPDEVAIELDAEELAIIDESCRESLRGVIEQRFAQALHARGELFGDASWRVEPTWRPSDAERE